MLCPMKPVQMFYNEKGSANSFVFIPIGPTYIGSTGKKTTRSEYLMSRPNASFLSTVNCRQFGLMCIMAEFCN